MQVRKVERTARESVWSGRKAGLLLPLEMPLTVLVAQEFDNLPDLVRFQLIAKWCHDGAAASPGDGVEDHRIGRLVNPFVGGEVGADGPFGFWALSGMAACFQEQAFPFYRGGGLSGERILEFFLRTRKV